LLPHLECGPKDGNGDSYNAENAQFLFVVFWDKPIKATGLCSL